MSISHDLLIVNLSGDSAVEKDDLEFQK